MRNEVSEKDGINFVTFDLIEWNIFQTEKKEKKEFWLN